MQNYLVALALLGSIVGLPPNLPRGPQADPAVEQNRRQPHREPTPLDGWIFRLGACESGNREGAINPKDRDGTASLGRFQFKPGTFRYYIEKYDLFPERSGWDNADWQNNIFDGWRQERIVRRMAEDEDVKWRWEFPDCVRKLGLPSHA